MENKKSSFSRIGAVLAITSSAVGLGNIWKFPTMTGKNGGAAFVLIFILASFFVSLPVLLVEFYIGHRTKKMPVGAFKELTPRNKFWQIIPLMGAIATLLTITYYSDVIGWILRYFVSSATGQVKITTMEEASNFFGTVVGNPASVLFFQVLVLAGICGIMLLGVVKGVEKTLKFSLPTLLVILVFLLFNSLKMSGASKAFTFLFTPDFSKITGSVVLSALGLAFFKLSAGFTAQMAYFSHFPENSDPMKSTVKCLFADLCVSMLCGLVVFPIVFTYNLEVNAGPGLLFMTMPVAFSKMKFGFIFMPVFFLLALSAAAGAALSIMTVANLYLEEQFGFSKKKAVLVNFCVSLLFGVLASLSTTNVLGSVKIAGKGFFDLFDFFSSNVLLPLVSLLLIVYLTCVLKKEDVISHMKKCGCGEKTVKLWYFLTKYLSSIIIVYVV